MNNNDSDFQIENKNNIYDREEIILTKSELLSLKVMIDKVLGL